VEPLKATCKTPGLSETIGNWSITLTMKPTRSRLVQKIITVLFKNYNLTLALLLFGRGEGVAYLTAIYTRDWDIQGYCYHQKTNLRLDCKPFAYVPENHT